MEEYRAPAKLAEVQRAALGGAVKEKLAEVLGVEVDSVMIVRAALPAPGRSHLTRRPPRPAQDYILVMVDNQKAFGYIAAMLDELFPGRAKEFTTWCAARSTHLLSLRRCSPSQALREDA